MWVADKLVYRGEDDFVRAYWGDELVWYKKLPGNMLIYTSVSGQVVVPYRDGRGWEGDDYTYAFGSRVTSNTYEDGYGFLVCESDITKVDYAFPNKTDLLTVVMPDGVINIGLCAFEWCTNLSSVVIPEGVQVIGQSSFYGCSSLSSIELPSTVSLIRWMAFWTCSNLSEVILDAVVPPDILDPLSPEESRANWPFKDCAADLVIKVPAGSVQAYRTANIWSNYASKIISQ